MVTTSPIHWEHKLAEEYLTIQSKYKFVSVSLKQFHDLKLHSSLHAPHTSLHGSVHDFFRRSLEHTRKIFFAENKSTNPPNKERLTRVVLSDVLKRYGGVTEAQINNFLKETLDTQVVVNTDQRLNSQALLWFDKTNLLIQKIDEYSTTLENQVNYLSTIFDTVLNKVDAESFTLDQGYTKLEIARFTGYLTGVKAKRRELEGIRDRMQTVVKQWTEKYREIKETYTSYKKGFDTEIVAGNRPALFGQCVEVVRKLVGELNTANDGIKEQEDRFKSLRSGLDELPYYVYFVYRNLAYIEQYIGYVKGGVELVVEIQEHMLLLEKQAKEYKDYYNKVDVYHRFVDHFRYNLCYEFNRKIERVAREVLLDYEGVN